MSKQDNLGKPGIADDCPCVQERCPIWGNCLECVGNHRKHQQHLPECMQPILRDLVTDLARKVELRVEENRPTPEFWEEFYKKKDARD
jgi:hypothetical protein